MMNTDHCVTWDDCLLLSSTGTKLYSLVTEALQWNLARFYTVVQWFRSNSRKCKLCCYDGNEA